MSLVHFKSPASHREQHRNWEKWMLSRHNAPPWKAINPPTAQLKPGPTKLRAVINDLDVENAPRYQPGPYGTYCNIFASDVITAMGFEPGHWVSQQTGEPRPQGMGQELNANGMCRWFEKFGAAKGWVQADRATATDAAERGHLVAVCWDSKTNKPGHIAIMLPEGTIAQAGKTNFVGKTIREGFGNLPVVFWVQSRSGSHQP